MAKVHFEDQRLRQSMTIDARTGRAIEPLVEFLRLTRNTDGHWSATAMSAATF